MQAIALSLLLTPLYLIYATDKLPGRPIDQFIKLELSKYEDHNTPEAINDGISGNELPIFTNTYYAIRNYGVNGYWSNYYSLTDKLDIWSNFQWAQFYPKTDGWYGMNFNGDVLTIKLNKSPSKGYYIINKDNCEDSSQIAWYYGYHPNSILKSNCLSYTEYQNEMVDLDFEGIPENHWELIDIYSQIARYYDVNVKLSKFKYTTPLDKVLEQHKQVDMLQNSIINNCSPASISDKVSLDKTVTQSYTVSVEKSFVWASRNTKSFGINAKVGASIFGIDAGIDTSSECSWELDKEVHDTHSSQVSTTKELKVSEQKQVNVPPETCVSVTSYVSFIKGLQLSYTATVEMSITGSTGVPLEAALARKLGVIYFGNREWYGDKVITFNTTGVITAGFGIDSYTEIKKVGTCPPGGSPVYFNQTEIN